MDLGREILRSIQKNKIPLCEGFTEKIKRTKNYATLCAMYFKGDDWSLENDFPRLDILRKHKEGIKDYNMFVDISGNFLNLSNVAFLGDSDANITYSSYGVGNIRVRHKSKLKVTAKNNSIVHITCLDEADLDIEVLDDASVIVYSYGTKVNLKTKGNIKVINRNEYSSI